MIACVMNGSMWAMMWAGPAFLLALTVGLLIFAGLHLRRAPNRARQVLEERYARGEIDRDELKSRLETLEGVG